MIIPPGVHQTDFVKKAHEKGITISSQFTGVTLWRGKSRKYVKYYWATFYKRKAVKLFPLTEQGELEALEHYNSLINKM